MGRLTHYQSAIWLSILSGAIALILIAFVFPKSEPEGTIFWGLLLIVPFGLWVGSNFVRYVGSLVLVISAGSVLWTLLASPGFVLQRLPLSALFVSLAAINLIVLWLLLLSKKFGIEFAEEQKKQPRYKTYLRRAVLYASIAAMAIATVNDIINLAASR